MKILAAIKKLYGFSNYSTKSKYYDDSNKLVIRKMEDETADVVIEEFIGLKPKIYSFLLDNNSEHKKARGRIKLFLKKLTHNQYKDALVNNKSTRNSMNRIQSKDHRIGTCAINKIQLSCFETIY